MKHGCGAQSKKIGPDPYSIGETIYYCSVCKEEFSAADTVCEDCGYPKEYCICQD